jgi:aldehyde dehydrogenase (NAD+)
VYTRREPFGVTGHIIAWNYPMQLLARAVAPAIAVGNSVVAKPADETPRTAVIFAELALEAGMPPGVLNIVTGIGAEAGAALSGHPGVDHIGFVGSAQIGSVVAHAAAGRLAPAPLELGGKSPQIVFPYAHLPRAAEFITKAILQNAGQTCSAGSRLLVHESIRDALLEMVCRRFRLVTIGPGVEDHDLGPLIGRKKQCRVASMISDNTKGEIICGGAVPDEPRLADGAYFAPTVIDDVDPASQLAQEEIFGPVLTVNSFRDEDEAITLANGTQYGLLAAVCTGDASRAHRLAGEVHGREKGYEALDTFTATKTVVVHLGGRDTGG